MTCKSALSAKSGKMRRYTNVVCCSSKILPSSSSPAPCGGALAANADEYIVRSPGPYDCWG